VAVKKRLMRLLTHLVWGAVVGCLAGAIGGWCTAQYLHVPVVDTMEGYLPASTTHVYDRSGQPVASFAHERRIPLRPEQIPDHLKLAIVAIEDANFYEHGGVDPQAIGRAAWYSLVDRKIGSRGGASTLTQQLALHLFLEREHSLRRKAREALLAIDIEKRYSKDQILTKYANAIFLGHGAYGVEAAARLYYDKPARDLTLAQAAMLAGIIPSANNRFDPIEKPETVVERRNKVLRRMLEQRFISSEDYATAVDEPLGASLHRKPIETGAYFVEMVRKYLEDNYGADQLYTGGLEVHLTMDHHLQEAAEEAVREGLVSLDMSLGFRRPTNVVEEGLAESPEAYQDVSWQHRPLRPEGMAKAVVLEVDASHATLRIDERTARLDKDGVKWTGSRSLKRVLKAGDLVLVRLPEELASDPEKALDVSLLQEPEPSLQAALIAMDNRSGEILALVGGYDFNRYKFNRAYQAQRQCGSAFKPFVYLSAFQQGYTPADTVFDAPFLLPDALGELTYCPKNYYNKYYGITTLRRALELSFNSSAVKLQQLVGGESVVETARNFGITSVLHPYPSLALGSLEVRLWDLTRAYAGIANLGEVPEPFAVTRILDRNHKVVEERFPHLERAMPASVTYLVLHVLRGVVERGTGVAARSIEANIAGKTGTTDDYTDAWFMGFTPRITVGVWVGRDLKEPIGKRMTGARAALPIWTRFVESYLETLDPEARAEDFPVPAGVVFSPVDWYTGKRAIPACDKVVLEAFLDGTEPVDSCLPEHLPVEDMPWPFQQPLYAPRPGEPMPSLEAIACADERLKPDAEKDVASR
jgi:penicillin-binding protein 1A